MIKYTFSDFNRLLNFFKCSDYAVFNSSWGNQVELDYHYNNDKRKVFLMELYMWSQVFLENSRKLFNSHSYIGILRFLIFKYFINIIL